jgi:hypothetical protein
VRVLILPYQQLEKLIVTLEKKLRMRAAISFKS